VPVLFDRLGTGSGVLGDEQPPFGFATAVAVSSQLEERMTEDRWEWGLEACFGEDTGTPEAAAVGLAFLLQDRGQRQRGSRKDGASPG
jgi:hypothetical protein